MFRQITGRKESTRLMLISDERELWTVKPVHVRQLPHVTHVLTSNAYSALGPNILQSIHHDFPQIRNGDFSTGILVFRQVVHHITRSNRSICSRKEFWILGKTFAQTLQYHIQSIILFEKRPTNNNNKFKRITLSNSVLPATPTNGLVSVYSRSQQYINNGQTLILHN